MSALESFVTILLSFEKSFVALVRKSLKVKVLKIYNHELSSGKMVEQVKPLPAKIVNALNRLFEAKVNNLDIMPTVDFLQAEFINKIPKGWEVILFQYDLYDCNEIILNGDLYKKQVAYWKWLKENKPQPMTRNFCEINQRTRNTDKVDEVVPEFSFDLGEVATATTTTTN